MSFSKHRLVFRAEEMTQKFKKKNQQWLRMNTRSWTAMMHIFAADNTCLVHLQEFDNAAYVSLLCVVHVIYLYYSVFIPPGKVNSLN